MKVTVTGGTLSHEEITAYIKHCTEKYKNRRIDSLDITIDGDYADIDINFRPVPFDRIRRITGYLVGTLDRFNNAKRAEVADRLKHNI